jgi:hypothetical protein
MPFGLRAADITKYLAGIDLPSNFDVVLATPRLDPLDDAVETRRRLDTLRELGATAITCSVAATSAGHFCDQLAALSDIGKETP